jgi:ATP-dependent exoDNAse (exonuclease V) beta subunit
MPDQAPRDQAARDRFRDEWGRNFAVSANAGSGKTTAISRRLAALALAPGAAAMLRTTAVVTYTRKAAAEIGRRARHELLRRLQAEGRTDLAPLDHLEQACFGTIHSFCLLLARRYGPGLGVNLNPQVLESDNDDELWAQFLEEDPMQFTRLAPRQVDAFLRHVPLEDIFDLARGLDEAAAGRLLDRVPAEVPPGPSAAALEKIRSAQARAGKAAANLAANQERASAWVRRFQTETRYLPIPEPAGTAGGIKPLYEELFRPLKSWLAGTAAVLAAELSLRYRAWRFDRGVQTYADQIDAARALLAEPTVLDLIRRDGWRVLLDEAQDTDAQQFEVLVEITRPRGAVPGTWPGAGAPGPQPGHFCLVGDGQQGIYSSRADIRKFQRQIAAFADGIDGEHLSFDVTFRTPRTVAEFLNQHLGPAFAADRPHNVGVPPAEGAPAPLLQVTYEPLVPAPASPAGSIGVIPLRPPPGSTRNVGPLLAEEVRQVARFLREGGPAAVGARTFGEICLIAPRNEWLTTARAELEALGLKAALQTRRTRNGDNPPYAWLAGLLAALCDPANPFEWTGVLREVFAVSDAAIAEALRDRGAFELDDPVRQSGAVADALAVLRPFVLRVEAEGEPLGRFASDLVAACGLPAKAAVLDPSGAMGEELDRLVNQAATLGLEGAGPRDWLRELLARIDDGRPAGKPDHDAINLLTSHSAKGLEWPVVIPLGLWRPLQAPSAHGLRVFPGQAGVPEVYFDGASVPAETAESRDRERLREQVRLLYVTLTRAKRVLALPFGEGFAARPGSFLDLWGADLTALPAIRAEVPDVEAAPMLQLDTPAAPRVDPGRFAVLPRRLLPHQLAGTGDLSRAARHESALDQLLSGSGGDEAIDYGLWWHELLEFTPWGAPEVEVEAQAARMLAGARARGFHERGEAEWRRLRSGAAWRQLNDPRWQRQAELGVFAPLGPEAWIDGVIDLILHDPAAREVWIVDWKTNQRRLGESDAALLERLAAEYRPQLRAYGESTAGLFPGCRTWLSVYSTAAGAFADV